MWDFNTMLFIASNEVNGYENKFASLEASEAENVTGKLEAIKQTEIQFSNQASQTKNPDARIIAGEFDTSEVLEEYGFSHKGITTNDDPHFVKCFWEVGEVTKEWEFHQSTVKEDKYYGGRESILLWEDGEGALRELAASQERDRRRDYQGVNAWGQEGVIVSLMGSLSCTLYKGTKFDTNVSALVPDDPSHLPAMWCFCTSEEFESRVRTIDQKVNVTNATLVKVPFDLEHWQEVAEEEYPDGLPDQYSDDPTQWIFHGHPKPSERPLQVAVARLLGYRWPAERDESMDLSDEAREWIDRAAELDEHADDDGIVCIPAVQGERKAVDRLRDLLADAWGDDWSEDVLNDLLEERGYKGRGLAAWLSGEGTPWGGKFAKQHNKLFGNRPFIWHITDTHEDGFSALVNYHMLDKANLERLTYTYLGDWIERQKNAEARGESGAESRRAAAEDLQAELKKIIEGDQPYDVFVRWKEAHEQPIGWDPDLNDGVLLNIKPFIKGDGRVGVLRDEPNVRYTKDRGKNPEGAPWGPLRYNRYEDVPDEHKLKDEKGNVIEHLTNEVKRTARDELSG
jgi:hypothetical protein